MMKTRRENESAEQFKAELSELNEQLNERQRLFDMTDDEDLIEALIYEQKALSSRFSYLLKQARETESIK